MTDRSPTIQGAELPPITDRSWIGKGQRAALLRKFIEWQEAPVGDASRPFADAVDEHLDMMLHTYACAAIAADRASRAAGQEPVAWVSVQDRLPSELADAYLVATIAKKTYPDGSNYPGMGIRAVAQDWVVRNYASNYTHWMPLPAAPRPAPQSPALAPEAGRVAGERGKKWHAALSAAGAYAQSCQGLLATPSTSAWMALQEALDALAAPVPVAQAVVADTQRLDWLDSQAKAYGFADIHEGNVWEIGGAYRSIRDAIDHERTALRPEASTAPPAPALYPLPDSLYPDSKDWLSGDYAARVEWLHTMYEARNADVERLESAPVQVMSEASPDAAKMVEEAKLAAARARNAAHGLHDVQGSIDACNAAIDALGAAATQARAAASEPLSVSVREVGLGCLFCGDDRCICSKANGHE